jgi:hypothetical protein
MDEGLRRVIDRLDVLLGMTGDARIYDSYAVATYYSPTGEALFNVAFRFQDEQWVYFNACLSLPDDLGSKIAQPL